EVEQEILAERFLRLQPMPLDHVAKRRQPVQTCANAGVPLHGRQRLTILAFSRNSAVYFLLSSSPPSLSAAPAPSIWNVSLATRSSETSRLEQMPMNSTPLGVSRTLVAPPTLVFLICSAQSGGS